MISDESTNEICEKACCMPLGPSGLAAEVGAFPVVIHGNYDP